MAKSRRVEIAVGGLLTVALVLLGWMAVKVGAIRGMAPSVLIELHMVDAAGIQSGSSLAVAGVEVGTIELMSLKGGEAVASARLDTSANLTQGTVARVRARSLLGEKYIELVPGPDDSAPLADGDILRIDTPQVEIDELVAMLAPVLEGVDVEALSKTLDSLSKALDEDPERVSRMLANADTLLENASLASNDLPQLTTDLRGIVSHAETSLGRADRALREIEEVASSAKQPLARADKMLADVGELGEPLDDLRGTLRAAREMLEGLDGAEDDLRQVLANFAEIDKWELRRLLREEGILVRLKKGEVVPEIASEGP